MPHKLTEAEKASAQALTKTLTAVLAPEHRSMASGIASGLIRVQARENPLPASEVHDVLKKYDAGEGTLKTLVHAGVLVRTKSGAFQLVAEVDDKGDVHGADNGALENSALEKDGVATSKPHDERTQGNNRGNRKSRSETSLTKSGPRQLARIDTVRKQTPELNAVRRRIIDLDPRLWINGYLLSAPNAYLAYERELKQLSAALLGHTTIGDGTLTMRELSYQVFGDEKFLAIESEGRKLLRLMGVNDLVRYRHTIKTDLLAYVPKRHKHLKLVVSENLDPWTNMRDALFLDGRKRLLDERVHGVVFGDGHLVCDVHKLVDLVATLGAEDVRILYWGDLDRAGLELMDKLNTALRERTEELDADDSGHARGSNRREDTTSITLEPFVPAYRLMLKRAQDRFPDPLDNRHTDQDNVPLVGLDLLEPVLEQDEVNYLKTLLDGARLIPQEIVTAADL